MSTPRHSLNRTWPRVALELGAIALLLIAPPVTGAWLAGRELGPLLELPPRPTPVTVPGFSWPMFIALGTFVAAIIAALLVRLTRTRLERRAPPPDPRFFPWWGFAGLALTALAWVLAWNRFPWFAPLQSHTFTPLWLGYILVVNALTCWRAGLCLLTAEPRFFLALFPLSAVFWWFFEFLNRFTGNWHYVGVETFSSLEYALLATLAFSTVLPAVLSTARLLETFPRIERAFADLGSLAPRRPRALAAAGLALAVGALFALGAWPAYSYPIVWVAPFVVIACLQTLAGEPTALAPLARGDWRPACVPALAALVCGFFWELWNAGSLAHWSYTIPFVDRFHLFEMPILGYAGYVPFGVECVVAASLLPRRGPPGPALR